MKMRIDNFRDLQTSSNRRCLRVSLLIFMIQLFAIANVRAEDRITVPTLQITPGTTQKLAVHLSNSEEYVAFQAEFYFPEGISPVKSGEGKYSVTLSSRGSDHSISSNLVSDGGLKVAVFSLSNKSLTGNDGELFSIDIQSEATFKGPATIEVKGILFTKAGDRKEIEFPNATGIVDTKAQTKGDVNIDGNINAMDIVETVNYMMGKQSGIFDSDAADVNGDYEVNSADIVKIVNLILNK